MRAACAAASRNAACGCPLRPGTSIRKKERGSSRKNTNLCPKCGCTDVLRIPGSANAYGTGNHMLAGRTVFSAVLVHRYVCCSCGYSEAWIDCADNPQAGKKYR